MRWQLKPSVCCSLLFLTRPSIWLFFYFVAGNCGDLGVFFLKLWPLLIRVKFHWQFFSIGNCRLSQLWPLICPTSWKKALHCNSRSVTVTLIPVNFLRRHSSPEDKKRRSNSCIHSMHVTKILGHKRIVTIYRAGKNFPLENCRKTHLSECFNNSLYKLNQTKNSNTVT